MVSKQTEEYLQRLEQEEKEGKPSTSYHANPDAIDQLIIENNLEIAGLNFYPQIDLMLIVLNNKKVLKESISKFKLLKGATKEQLENYHISRTGVHWEELDEDLSLRGFLITAVASSMSPVGKVA
ncbi:MAG: DUF2442 domain-containing protein [Bacteroidota bacterium]